MKAAVQSALPQAIYEDLVYEDFDDAEQKMRHVFTLYGMRIFGVNLGDGLKQFDYFFSETSYLRDRAHGLVTRDRSMTASCDPSCWSQEGEPVEIIDIGDGSIVGMRTRFRLFEEPASTGNHFLHVGTKAYEFTLDEFVTEADDRNEKIMMSVNQVPRSFVCLYKIIPHINASSSMGSEGVIHDSTRGSTSTSSNEIEPAPGENVDRQLEEAYSPEDQNSLALKQIEHQGRDF